jgi:hypothetical protein
MHERRSRIGQRLFVAVLVGCISTGLAFAHHGWSSYDADKTLTLTGTLRESSYSNPHGMTRLQVDGKDGKNWLVILAPPSRMSARGLTQEMLKDGTTATVVGYPHREKADELRAERITINGKTIELR